MKNNNRSLVFKKVSNCQKQVVVRHKYLHPFFAPIRLLKGKLCKCTLWKKTRIGQNDTFGPLGTSVHPLPVSIWAIMLAYKKYKAPAAVNKFYGSRGPAFSVENDIKATGFL
jgi:hypothetical protein